jgi:hypothetical protein
LGIQWSRQPTHPKPITISSKKSSPLTPEQQKQFNDWLTPISQAATAGEDPLEPDNDTLYHGTIVYVLLSKAGFESFTR